MSEELIDNALNVGGVGGILITLFWMFLHQHKEDMTIIKDMLSELGEILKKQQQREVIETYVKELFERHDRVKQRSEPAYDALSRYERD
jgi:hypothetical protein